MRLKPNWSAVASSYKTAVCRYSLRESSWNGIVIRTNRDRHLT
ncbi:MAG: hypothetical protein QOH32_370 [Bradyrhizobium sp.]|nr:hypothetical protein [Bradyrhizobium sp.]